MRRFREIAASLFSRDRQETPSRIESIFDREHYLRVNEDVRQAGIDPWRHFLAHGWKEGRDPHPDFDVAWYLDRNADVAIKGMNPFEHFVAHGWQEGRQPKENQICDRLAVFEHEKDPDSFNPLDHLVSVNGDFHDWSDQVRMTAERDPEEALQLCLLWKRTGGELNFLPRLRMSELLIGLGRYDEAGRELEEAIELEPDRDEMLLSLAECSIRRGDLEAFSAIAGRIEAVHADFFEIATGGSRNLRLKGFRWLESGRLLEAFALFDQLAAESPDDDLALLGRGEALFQLGSRDESFADLWQAMRTNPNLMTSEGWKNRLDSALSPEDGFALVREFPEGLEGWLECDPEEQLTRLHGIARDSASISRLSAHLLTAQGDVEGAIEAFESAGGSLPESCGAGGMLGRLLENEGRLTEALDAFETMSDQNPDVPYFCFRSLRLLDLRDVPGTVAKRLPSDTGACLEFGRALVLSEKYHTGAASFSKGAVKAAEKSEQVECYTGIARCFLRRGEYRLAEDSAGRALEIDGTAGDAHAIAGTVSRHFGKRDQAIGHYGKAIESSSQEPWIYRHLAEELDRQGERSEAIGVLKAGRNLHPDDPELQRDANRLRWLRRLHRHSVAKSSNQPVTPEQDREFVALLRNLIDADWPVIGRDFAECRVCMDRVIHKGENAPLHEAYGDLLVRCGNKFDGLGYFEEAHRIAAADGYYDIVQSVVAKIIAALEQLELYERCIPYLEAAVHGRPPVDCQPQYRRLACYSAMLGKNDQARQHWQTLLGG